MKKLSILFFVAVASVTMNAQSHRLVFNTDGKIIKNYGFEKPAKKGTKITMIIEDIEESEKDNYLLFFKPRNEYNYEVNSINPLKKQGYYHYGDKGFSIDFDLIVAKDRFFNYQLVYVNDTLVPFLPKTRDISLGEIQEKFSSIKKEMILKYYNEATTEAQQTLRDRAIILKNIQTINDEQKLFKDEKHSLSKEKNKLKKQLEVKEKVLESLLKITHSPNTPKEIVAIGKEIDTISSKILEKEFEIDVKKIHLKSNIELLTKTLAKKKKHFITQITKVNNTPKFPSYLKKPSYKVLHQGILISKDKDLHEIVYDINYNKRISANNPQLEIARITPDLPQLTTDSKLYAHIINLKPENLKNTPFKISMTSSQSDSVIIESPSNFKSIENIDTSISSLLSNLLPKSNSNESFDSIAIGSTKEQLESIFKIIALKATVTPNYTEYILKYPKSFTANTATTINLYAMQKITTNFLVKVEKGKESKPSYDITYTNKLLVTDELPATHKLYRLALNAGGLVTNSISYTYQRNTDTQKLEENKKSMLKVNPSLTVSLYLKKQNLSLDDPNPWRTTHFDLSIDYGDGNLLDNIYLGMGLEPWRNVHFMGGARFGSVKRIDNDLYDFSIDNQDAALIKKFAMGYYFGISFGTDLVPTLIKSLF